jgi:hypothetical protein
MMLDDDDDDDDHDDDDDEYDGDGDDRDRIAWQAASAQYNLRTQYRLGAAIKK